MTKPKVDDAMVTRACWGASRSRFYDAKLQFTDAVKDDMRFILEAALTEPPAEPEVAVTGDQMRAGMDVQIGFGGAWLTKEQLAQIFRAMYAKLPKPAAVESAEHCDSIDVSVGMMLGRTDDLMVLRVGKSAAYLDKAEQSWLWNAILDWKQPDRRKANPNG